MMNLSIEGNKIIVDGYYDVEENFFYVDTVRVDCVYGNIQPVTEILIYFVQAYMQKELIAEYKRVAKEELGDMIIDRHLTDMD